MGAGHSRLCAARELDNLGQFRKILAGQRHLDLDIKTGLTGRLDTFDGLTPGTFHSAESVVGGRDQGIKADPDSRQSALRQALCSVRGQHRAVRPEDDGQPS